MGGQFSVTRIKLAFHEGKGASALGEAPLPRSTVPSVTGRMNWTFISMVAPGPATLATRWPIEMSIALHMTPAMQAPLRVADHVGDRETHAAGGLVGVRRVPRAGR